MWSGWQARAAQPSQPATVVPVGVPAGWKMQPDEEGTRVVSPSGDACYLWDLDSRHAEAGQCHREVLRQLCQDLLFSAPSAPAESGWQWVPVEPTPEMVKVAMQRMFDEKRYNAPWEDVINLMYRATLKAAPSAAQPGGEST
jgi:hypothetical protein